MKTKMTVEERFFENGILKTIPSKHTAKLQVMEYIAAQFASEKVYSEKEVNELIKLIYPDFAIVRRYLIDYKLLSRSKDGKEYWITNK